MRRKWEMGNQYYRAVVALGRILVCSEVDSLHNTNHHAYAQYNKLQKKEEYKSDVTMPSLGWSICIDARILEAGGVILSRLARELSRLARDLHLSTS